MSQLSTRSVTWCAAVAAAAHLTAAAPATAAVRAPPGTYCAPAAEAYGQNRWTYVKYEVCLVVDDSSAARVTVEPQDSMYFFGDEWHAGRQHRLRWSAQGTVDGPDGTSTAFTIDGVVQNGLGKAASRDTVPVTECGEHTATTRFKFIGPYWSEDAAIDAGDLPHAIQIPCDS